MERAVLRHLAVALAVWLSVPVPTTAQYLPHSGTILGPFDAEDLVSHGAELGKEAVTALAPTAAGIRAAVANEIASLAISAAGTQYFFGADRTFYVSGNLGSFFVEPPWTSGRGSGSLSLNVTDLQFDVFDGKDLDDLFDFFEPATGEKLWESRYRLHGTLYALSGTYGISEHWDVGFVAPYIKLTGEGEWGLTLRSGAMATKLWDFHETAEGPGDIFLRTKYELLEVEDLNNLAAWSVGADVKLPTGDEDELLGTGDWGYRVRTLIGKRFGRIYPTVELAYYWAGVDAIEAIHTRWEGSDAVFDTGIDDNDFDAVEFKAAVPVDLIEERWTVSVEYLLRRYNRDGPNRTAADLGLSSRFRVSDSFFVQCGIRIPQDESGLRSDLISTIGGEIRF